MPVDADHLLMSSTAKPAKRTEAAVADVPIVAEPPSSSTRSGRETLNGAALYPARGILVSTTIQDDRMLLTRDQVQDIVQALPEPVDTEELIHRIYLLEKLTRAEEDVVAGRTLSHDEVKARIAAWPT